MDGDILDGHMSQGTLQDFSHGSRGADPNGVGDDDLIAPAKMQFPRDGRHQLGRHLAFKRTAEGTRDVATYWDAACAGGGGDGEGALGSLLEGGVDVLA